MLFVILATAFGFSALSVSAAPAPNWHVSDYNRSGQAFRQREPDNLAGGIASFQMLNTPDTALLTTDHGASKGQLLGSMSGKCLTATVGITATPGTTFD